MPLAPFLASSLVVPMFHFLQHSSLIGKRPEPTRPSHHRGLVQLYNSSEGR
ncbi:hypothetical protein SynBIOSE41_01296 [Synechococcus sp. BIOS-E4-1]|nr:hypothetical protein SynBIOSE41_01296 [Synechococcus sp. BIOS-E4-1]